MRLVSGKKGIKKGGDLPNFRKKKLRGKKGETGDCPP